MWIWGGLEVERAGEDAHSAIQGVHAVNRKMKSYTTWSLAPGRSCMRHQHVLLFAAQNSLTITCLRRQILSACDRAAFGLAESFLPRRLVRLFGPGRGGVQLSPCHAIHELNRDASSCPGSSYWPSERQKPSTAAQHDCGPSEDSPEVDHGIMEGKIDEEQRRRSSQW